jgi:hypothetical protein
MYVPPATNRTLLELHVPDFQKVKEYYGKIGFEVVWERTPEDFKGYLVLTMEENILCFWCGNQSVRNHPYFKKFPPTTQPGYGVEIIIMVVNVEAYYNRVKDSANVVDPINRQPWGLKNFRVADPFGYYLRVTEKHDILDPKYAVP